MNDLPKTKVAVVGLGKLGLPLAVQFASKGFTVQGYDIQESVVDAVNQGLLPASEEEDLQIVWGEPCVKSRLTATSNPSLAFSDSDVIVVTVPLLSDPLGLPIFRALDSAAESIGLNLKPGALVCLETTVPVGTTRSRFSTALERASRLKAGRDFYLAFSPERVLTGRVFKDLRKYPKLVGGINAKSSELALHFYDMALDFDERPDLERKNGAWDLGSCEAAELAKLAETTYRDVNIALANQFAIFAEGAGLDIYEVIAAANSQPFSHIHNPGISVGGHCIPVYPNLYLFGDPSAELVRVARQVNLSIPTRVVETIENELGGLTGRTVVILGLAYRPGVKEHANSGAFLLADEIAKRGGQAKVHDPLYSPKELSDFGLTPFEIGDSCDAAVIHTAHEEYESPFPEALSTATYVYDGRNALGQACFLNVKVATLGVGVSKGS